MRRETRPYFSTRQKFEALAKTVATALAAAFSDLDAIETPQPELAIIDGWDGLMTRPTQLGQHAQQHYQFFPVCPACRGIGGTRGDRVPYGNTTAELPGEQCHRCLGTCVDLKDARCAPIAAALRDAFLEGANALDDLDTRPTTILSADNYAALQQRARECYPNPGLDP